MIVDYDGSIGKFSYDNELWQIVNIDDCGEYEKELAKQCKISEYIKYIGDFKNGEIIGEVPDISELFMTFANCIDLKVMPKMSKRLRLICQPFIGCINLNNFINLRSYSSSKRIGGCVLSKSGIRWINNERNLYMMKYIVL